MIGRLTAQGRASLKVHLDRGFGSVDQDVGAELGRGDRLRVVLVLLGPERGLDAVRGGDGAHAAVEDDVPVVRRVAGA